MKFKSLAAVLLTAILLFSLPSCKNNGPGEFYELTANVGDRKVTVILARDTGLLDDEKNKIILDDGKLYKIANEAVKAASNALAKYTPSGNEALSELNMQHKYVLDLPDDLIEFYNTARGYASVTDGAYEPVSGTVYDLYKEAIPSDESITEAMTHIGDGKIVINGRDAEKIDVYATVDFGVLCEGYALQRMKEYLESSESPYGMVTMGSAVLVFGTRPDDTPYRVKSTVPSKDSSFSGTFLMTGGYLYSVSNISSVIDPRTGKASIENSREICVYSENALDAAVVAQAVSVGGMDMMNRLYNSDGISFEAAVVDSGGNLILTPGFSDSDAVMFETAPPETEKGSK